ncbi:MAG: OmpH family outer membrane protein [Nitrospirae bacterium]|nr:OmpH family outer membrane protein [Nitrospirota bacterium]
MKKIWERNCFAILSGLVLLLFFGANVSRAEVATKIAYVDLFKAINESEAGLKAKNTLDDLIKSKQTTLDKKVKEIEKLKSEFEKQASVLSEDVKKKKLEEVESLQRDYQRLLQDSQTEVKKKEAELTGSILREMREIINKIAEEEGYALILEKAEGVVLYGSKNIDITDKVIKKHNETRKSGEKKTKK